MKSPLARMVGVSRPNSEEVIELRRRALAEQDLAIIDLGMVHNEISEKLIRTEAREQIRTLAKYEQTIRGK